MKIGPTPPTPPNVFEDVKVRAYNQPDKYEGATFGEIIEDAIDSVNTTVTEVGRKNFQLAMGEIDDVSEVMIAGQKASLALDLTLEIRNRLVEAYEKTLRLGA